MSIGEIWESLLIEKTNQNQEKQEKNLFTSYHFCISYQDLSILIALFKKYNNNSPLINKNLNYLNVYLKSEISSKLKVEVMENMFFIFSSTKFEQKYSLENLLKNIEQKPNDNYKKFIYDLLLNEEDVAIFENIFYSWEKEISDLKQKQKLVN